MSYNGPTIKEIKEGYEVSSRRARILRMIIEDGLTLIGIEGMLTWTLGGIAQTVFPEKNADNWKLCLQAVMIYRAWRRDHPIYFLPTVDYLTATERMTVYEAGKYRGSMKTVLAEFGKSVYLIPADELVEIILPLKDAGDRIGTSKGLFGRRCKTRRAVNLLQAWGQDPATGEMV